MRSDLLGSEFIVYTDHRTLENFDTHRDLSKRQLRWQEFMSQYEMNITYIRREDNCVADALSWLPLTRSLMKTQFVALWHNLIIAMLSGWCENIKHISNLSISLNKLVALYLEN